jgi:uncharacterized protein (DUF58 family)
LQRKARPREAGKRTKIFDFRSVFRGEGIEFDEVRLYESGDDVRSIDRNVSARYGKPFVKLYREERELTVLLVLDCSASMFAGCSPRVELTRYNQALLACALIAFSAEHSGQRLGAVLFDNETRHIFKPRKGRSHVMAFTSAALNMKGNPRGTALSSSIASAGRVLKRRSIVVIASDFLSIGWETELARLSEKHDCIACRVYDPIDQEFPNVGLVSICDPETGKTIAVDSGASSFRAVWAERGAERVATWTGICRRFGVAALELSTADDAVSVVKGFFRARKRR